MRFRKSRLFGMACAFVVSICLAGQGTFAKSPSDQQMTGQARMVNRSTGVNINQVGSASNKSKSAAETSVHTQHKTAAIPFQTIRRETDLLFKGQTHVLSYGVKGLLRRNIINVYRNGRLLRRRVETKVIRKPKSEVVLVGTKVRASTSLSGRSENGFNVIKTLTVEATAYVGGGRTATGVLAEPGVIAVDPSVIPLGTKLYIPGVGVVRAEDTGGAIIGEHIDICVSSYAAAETWGVRTIQVYEIQ